MNITICMIPQELWKNLEPPFAIVNNHYKTNKRLRNSIGWKEI